MIGRAAIGYPWILYEIIEYLDSKYKLPNPTFSERVNTCKKHLSFSIEWKGERKGIFEMRRHYTAYFKGIINFKPFRTKLVEATSAKDVLTIFEEIKNAFTSEDPTLNQRK